MKSDLDKLLDGEQIYRHEDLKANQDKWNAVASFMQITSVFALFPIMLILDNLPKAQARVVVWWMVIPLFIYGTVAFFVARIALKKRMAYFRAEHSRVIDITDDAISRLEN